MIRRPADYGRVGVLCGGWSTEREISLQSGTRVFRALAARGVEAELVDIDRDMLLDGSLRRFDRVLNVVHGTGGEDGTLQAVLDLLGLPYAGCGVMASALAMDKLRSKQVWAALDLPTPAFAVAADIDTARRDAERLGYPLFVKPVDDGSSVGISKVREPEALAAAFAAAAEHGEVLLEAFVDGQEYTCGVLGDLALPLIWIEPDGDFYDYHAKYVSDATRYHCPAPLDAARTLALQQLSLQAFAALGGRDWGRVDFMLDAAGRPQLLEVNTVPGMTEHSLVPRAAAVAGIDFEALCLRLLDLTLEAGA